MSVRYFIYSINYCDYKSEVCEITRKNCKTATEFQMSYPRMGYHADKTDETLRSGLNTFYTNTTFKVPFCRDIHPNMIIKANNYNAKYSKYIHGIIKLKYLILNFFI
jgi:hypothetical protein